MRVQCASLFLRKSIAGVLADLFSQKMRSTQRFVLFSNGHRGVKRHRGIWEMLYHFWMLENRCTNLGDPSIQARSPSLPQLSPLTIFFFLLPPHPLFYPSHQFISVQRFSLFSLSFLKFANAGAASQCEANTRVHKRHCLRMRSVS